MTVFRRAARTVPAYRAFLKEHGIRPRDIRTFEDFQQLPTTSKEDYLLKYDLAELMPGGRLDGSCVITRSSGYSGNSLFWPRLKRQDDGAVLGLHAYYSLFDISQKSTLLLIGLALGTHIGGQFMTDVSLRVARMPHTRLTVATPGESIDDIIELVKHLSTRFDQTIVIGYPSLLQQLSAVGAERGVQWSTVNAFLISGGESWSEDWRRLVVGLVGGPSHLMRVSGIYGSADGGFMGFETPFSILAKQLSHERANLRRRLFGGRPNAAFVQFNPAGRFFERIDGELSLTCWQAVPLVRYRLHDAGEVMPYSAVVQHFGSCGLAPDELLASHGVRPEHIWRWPFLSCFGRSDGTVSVVSANVYPHSLRHIFAAHRELSHFKLAVEGEGGSDSRFVVYAECAPGRPLSAGTRQRLEQKLHDEIVATLLQRNAEYRDALRTHPEVADPRIVIVPHGTGPFAEDAGRSKRFYIHRGGTTEGRK
jgi:phenylacetate-CoA ligase